MKLYLRAPVGFTLVEVMVVMAVIALLCAIIFPSLATVRESARKATCLSNLHQIGIGIALYSHDYDDYMPYGPDPLAKTFDENGFDKYGNEWDKLVLILPDIRTLLQTYGTINAVFKCPSDTISQGLPTLIGQTRLPATYFVYCGSSYNYSQNGLIPMPFAALSRPAESYLMGDYDCFHSSGDTSCDTGFFGVLYVDLHTKHITKSQRGVAIDMAEE